MTPQSNSFDRFYEQSRMLIVQPFYLNSHTALLAYEDILKKRGEGKTSFYSRKIS
jgi:hypothetical protein